jgi:hypothetical protein
VQTPQAFRYAALLDAHRRAAQAGREDFPDDAALIAWAGLKVTVFGGERGNIKMTTPEDFTRIERDAQAALSDVRTGIGYDIHAFDQGGDHVWLGGSQDPACAQASGPLRCRRGAACADRRDPRRARRRRHRRALSAERREMARRLVRPLPRLRGRARETARRRR